MISGRYTYASPEDVQRTLTDLDSGTGPISAMGRVRASRTLAAGPDGKPVEPNSDPEDYRFRRGLADKYRATLVRRAEIMQDDPASYAAQNPALRDTMQAASSQASTPDQRSAAVSAVLAEQERLGIPADKRQALPRAQIAADVEALTKTDPSKVDMGMALSAKAAAYGSAWHDVFGAYVKHGLPSEYQALAIMDRPDQAADRSDFQRALALSVGPKGAEGLKEAAGKANVKDIDTNLESKLDDFKATVRDDQNGERLYNSFRNSVRTLAYYRAYQGDPPGEALQKAVDGILNKRYTFDGTMRVPKGQLSNVRVATRAELGGLSAEGLAPIAGNDALTSEQRQGALLAAARRDGQWVPSPDDGGLRLIVRTRDGVPRPVNRVDGTPVEVRFDRLHGLPDLPPPLPGAMFMLP